MADRHDVTCFRPTPIVVRVLLGLVIVFLGIAGDLFESRLKRLPA